LRVISSLSACVVSLILLSIASFCSFQLQRTKEPHRQTGQQSRASIATACGLSAAKNRQSRHHTRAQAHRGSSRLMRMCSAMSA
jgi:CHASE3 domain sensor protein